MSRPISRSGWAGVVVAAAVLSLVAVAVLRREDGGGSEADASSPEVELTTITVERRDLVTYEETAASLEFAQTASLAAPVDGTVTTVAADGSSLPAGSVVASIDGLPVVAMTGEIPAWRELSTDSEDGVDVRQLELNLVALGFDPDGAIEIDETFDEATAAAVALWEQQLGLDDPDGDVPLGQILFVPGEVLVVEQTASVGAGVERGEALVESKVSPRQFPVAAALGEPSQDSPTVVDHVAPAGTPVATGSVLFWQGGVPVVAVESDLASFPALGRDLSVGVADGSDVKVLEQLLQAAGADPDGAMTVDDHFDEATAAAVVRWWQAAGATDPAVDPTAEATSVVVPAGSIVGVPSGLSVDEGALADGTILTTDATALALTSPSRVVKADVEVGSTSFAAGAAVDVELPDGSIVGATVATVGTVASTGGDGQAPTVPVTLTLDADETAEVASLTEVPVTLRTIAESTADTLVVPVTALIALSEGGYAVEVVGADGITTALAAVDVGQFTDGFVAVSSGDVAEGDEVVVPS